MSLDWNLGKIKDYEDLWPHDRHDWDDLTKEQIQEGLKTEALIWLTIGIGISKITEENVDEFTTRIIMWEEAHGNYLRLDSEPYRLTREDVVRRIGLSTNAASKTKTQYNKMIAEVTRNWAERMMESQKKEKAVA